MPLSRTISLLQHSSWNVLQNFFSLTLSPIFKVLQTTIYHFPVCTLHIHIYSISAPEKAWHQSTNTISIRIWNQSSFVYKWHHDWLTKPIPVTEFCMFYDSDFSKLSHTFILSKFYLSSKYFYSLVWAGEWNITPLQCIEQLGSDHSSQHINTDTFANRCRWDGS